jgi:hypothetical protein
MLGRASPLHNDALGLWGGDLLIAFSEPIYLNFL